MYATAIYAVCDMANRTMRVSSAGHPPPLIARPDGQVHASNVDTTLCLLWSELTDIPCAEHRLAPGDRWAFFTDGVTDRQSPDGTMFDLERLSSALGRHGRGTPQEIVTAIVGELDEFSGGVEPEDDQTLLIVGFD
jgi:sigma-B regulation protein RsbU (phosphoserine phosphatase)